MITSLINEINKMRNKTVRKLKIKNRKSENETRKPRQVSRLIYLHLIKFLLLLNVLILVHVGCLDELKDSKRNQRLIKDIGESKMSSKKKRRKNWALRFFLSCRDACWGGINSLLHSCGWVISADWIIPNKDRIGVEMSEMSNSENIKFRSDIYYSFFSWGKLHSFLKDNSIIYGIRIQQIYHFI